MERVLFYVQHLLGVGHVKRATLIAQAMVEAGLDVHVVLGGTPVDGMTFDGCTCHELPQARAADAAFSGLVDYNGRPVDDTWRDDRRDQLLALYTDLAPDVLLIEQFPFGRRQFRFELLPLLDLALASKPRPRIVCSVRDILVTKNTPAKHQQTVDYIDAYFDTVIVHGDPAFVPFETTFPLAYAFAGKIHYSGYVAPPENPNTEDCVDTGRDEVIVAAGGGAVGADLMICVARAKAQSSLSHLTWRFLIGPNLPSSIVSAIADLNDPGILIEPNRSDYGALLKNCTLSISQGGYNTMMDIIRAGCAAIVVPFGSGDEDEQSRRAAILHNHGYVTMIAETALSLDLLSAGINQAISRSHSKYSPFSLEGATRTAGIITNKR